MIPKRLRKIVSMEDIISAEADIFHVVSDDLDHVARIQEQWARERPDLDTGAMGIIGRLHRLADALHAELRPVFEKAGLSDGDFDVLAALRRAGDPFALTPGQLAETTMITSGTVTKRVDRLAAAGLVTRERVEHDGAYAASPSPPPAATSSTRWSGSTSPTRSGCSPGSPRWSARG